RESAGEGVDGLEKHIRASMPAGNGALVHVTGDARAGDLAAALRPFGYRVRTDQAYATHPAEALSGALTTEIGAGLIDAATFFSPRTAQLFATLVSAAELAQACNNVTALTLSEAVAKALGPLAFRRVLIARAQTTDALLDLIPGI